MPVRGTDPLLAIKPSKINDVEKRNKENDTGKGKHSGGITFGSQ